MGLSKAKYVESEITEINQSLAAIEAMETRLLDVERVASDISTLQDQIDQIIQIENELSASNAALNTRVDGLPKEIVVGLINAMQIYLDSLSP